MTPAVRKAGVRFGKFSLVGAAGAAVQVAVFDLLIRQLHLPAVAAAPIAVETAVLHNFLWHERVTWSDRSRAGMRETARRLWRFHAANGLVSAAGNTLMAFCLVEQLRLPGVVSQAAAIALCAPLNFWIADRWVYGR